MLPRMASGSETPVKSSLSWMHVHEGNCPGRWSPWLCGLLNFQWKSTCAYQNQCFQGYNGHVLVLALLVFFLCSVTKPPTRNKPSFSLVICLVVPDRTVISQEYLTPVVLRDLITKNPFLGWDGEGLFACSYLQETKTWGQRSLHSPKI